MPLGWQKERDEYSLKILITGGSGQLGRSVQKQLQALPVTVFTPDHSQLNITNAEQVSRYICVVKPDIVLHFAAFNKVDLAQEEPHICRQINVYGTQLIAEASKKVGAYLLYTSSDYVFDGKKDGPYEVFDLRNPLSVYGQSKADGEDIVLGSDLECAVLRISWLFGESQNNFVEAILRKANSSKQIDVVADQVGSPTYTDDLAILIQDMIRLRPCGIFHATNEGYCSRAQFAKAILALTFSDTDVREVTSQQFPAKAPRPMNSRLSKDCLDRLNLMRLPPWQEALERYLSKRK